jgi:hypothetical protein
MSANKCDCKPITFIINQNLYGTALVGRQICFRLCRIILGLEFWKMQQEEGEGLGMGRVRNGQIIYACNPRYSRGGF